LGGRRVLSGAIDQKNMEPLKAKNQKLKKTGLGSQPYTAHQKRPSTGAFFLAKA
jgi:hypothetical protein